MLVGTRSVEASERLGADLTKKGIDHRALNARQDETEAEIVAEAGEPGRISVATKYGGAGHGYQVSQICFRTGRLARDFDGIPRYRAG